MALVSCFYLPADESYYKKNGNFGHASPFFPVEVKRKVVKYVHYCRDLRLEVARRSQEHGTRRHGTSWKHLMNKTRR